jgi:hypothetical protein
MKVVLPSLIHTLSLFVVCCFSGETPTHVEALMLFHKSSFRVGSSRSGISNLSPSLDKS